MFTMRSSDDFDSNWKFNEKYFYSLSTKIIYVCFRETPRNAVVNYMNCNISWTTPNRYALGLIPNCRSCGKYRSCVYYRYSGNIVNACRELLRQGLEAQAVEARLVQANVHLCRLCLCLFLSLDFSDIL